MATSPQRSDLSNKPAVQQDRSGVAADPLWREQTIARAGNLARALERALAEVREREEHGDGTERLCKLATEVGELSTQIAHGRLALSLGGLARLAKEMARLSALESEAVDVLPDREILTEEQNMIARVDQYLPRNDPRRLQVERLAGFGPTTLSSERRRALSGALNAAAEREQENVARVRSASKAITAISAIACGLAVVLGVIGIVAPDAIPMCFTPGRSAVCPLHESAAGSQTAASTRWDMVLVELIGALAGLLGLVLAASRLSSGALRYFLAEVATLRVASGAICAVGGVLLLRAQIVPGFGNLDSSAQVLGWSLLLGFAEELFTRPVDRNLQRVMSAVVAAQSEEPPGADEVVNWLNRSLEPKLDRVVKAGVEPVVRSVIAETVPEVVKETVAGPPLANFDGWVSIEVTQGDGQKVEIGADYRLTVRRQSSYIFNVAMSTAPGGGFALPLKITGGVDESVIDFDVALDSSDIAWRHHQQTVRVGVIDRPTARFDLTTGAATGSRWVWIKVGQRGRLVLQLELEVTVIDEDQPGDHA